MKDGRNHHGAVDKSFSKQQIRVADANYILCEKNWTRTCSGTGSYGRQAGDRRNTGEFVKLVFKVRKFMKPYDFLPIPTIKYYRT